MTTEKENYTLKEVAELGILPYSWRTLRRMIDRGEINAQAFVLGKRPRYMISRRELERVQSVLQSPGVINSERTGSQLENKDAGA